MRAQEGNQEDEDCVDACCCECRSYGLGLAGALLCFDVGTDENPESTGERR